MLKKLLSICFAFAFIACNNSNKFTVTGTISNADNQTLYFEHNSLVKDSLIDSVKLNQNGNFKFKSIHPAYPDLYTLRIGNQKIVLGVDSSETISVTADADKLIDAEIVNSIPSSDIQKLRKSVLKLQNAALLIGAEKDQAKQKQMLDSFSVNVENHKKTVMALILKNPRSIAAYFALYQQVNGLYIISPYDKKDRTYFSAVATSFDTYMPDYDRSKNLHNLVIDALKQDKAQEQQQLLTQLQNTSGISFPEIELNDAKGVSHKLSSLRGKTIVLDFSAAEMENNIEYTFELRDIYNTYSGKGLQIYQVSLDQNKMLWERAITNLPWICVRDENGPSSKYVSIYNVQNIPTIFLIDKTGNIVGRYTDFNLLKKDIKRVI
ncbi:conserved exported hypothetical protein [uncultured Paludibacter sp.]|uniref:Thioredoxin domain-containing protein n=1 Tax=uncultured Paludibacter sp. TaxID=497635 RepID=A0A653AJI0_9BACT|nr:conserved exported hypothetical protein [uncultured Paludibacter sp.]